MSIPDEFRGDMAMTGDWQVVSERIVDPGTTGGKKPDAIGFGVRKRTAPTEEDEDEAPRKKNWNQRYTYPGGGVDNDLDALLHSATTKIKETPLDPDIKQETGPDVVPINAVLKSEEGFIDAVKAEVPQIKKEVSDDLSLNTIDAATNFKQDNEANGGGIVFKKRKAKNIRQK